MVNDQQNVAKEKEEAKDLQRKASEVSVESGAPEGVSVAPEVEGTAEAIESVVPKEKVSEVKEGEKAARPAAAKPAKTGKKDEGAVTTPADSELPSTPIMKKKIEDKLNHDIKKLEKLARKHRGGLFRPVAAEALNKVLAEIRKLKRTVAELAYMAYDAVKQLYVSLFYSNKNTNV